MTVPILELTTTTETEEQALALARRLVEQRWAACVQISGPIHSVYRWKAEVCDGPEYRLSVKSTTQLEESLTRYLKQHHPYETPEILLREVRVSEEYAQWLQEQVQHP